LNINYQLQLITCSGWRIFDDVHIETTYIPDFTGTAFIVKSSHCSRKISTATSKREIHFQVNYIYMIQLQLTCNLLVASHKQYGWNEEMDMRIYKTEEW